MVFALGVLAGCGAQPPDQATYQAKPREPYSGARYASTRLILERTDSGFEVVSSAPSFGGVTQPNVEETLPDLLEGKQRLYEYAVRDDAGAVVAQGNLLVPLMARATLTEEDDPEKIHHVETADPSSIVRVAIPFVPDGATVEFRALTPDPSLPYQEWTKEDAGSVRLEPSAAQQPPREAAP